MSSSRLLLSAARIAAAIATAEFAARPEYRLKTLAVAAGLVIALLIALLLALRFLVLLGLGGFGVPLGSPGRDASRGPELVRNLACFSALWGALAVVRDAPFVHPLEYLAERRCDRPREDQKVH